MKYMIGTHSTIGAEKELNSAMQCKGTDLVNTTYDLQ